MVNINNSETIKEIIAGSKLNASLGVPNQLNNNVVPVLEVNPKLLRRVTIIKKALTTTSANATLYTTPTGADFYLCGIYFNWFKDAACDMASGSVYVTIVVNGETTNLVECPAITLTAQTQVMWLIFDKPIKLDRNTAVISARSGAHAAGVMYRACEIFGYLDESSNA